MNREQRNELCRYYGVFSEEKTDQRTAIFDVPKRAADFIDKLEETKLADLPAFLEEEYPHIEICDSDLSHLCNGFRAIDALDNIGPRICDALVLLCGPSERRSDVIEMNELESLSELELYKWVLREIVNDFAPLYALVTDPDLMQFDEAELRRYGENKLTLDIAKLTKIKEELAEELEEPITKEEP